MEGTEKNSIEIGKAVSGGEPAKTSRNVGFFSFYFLFAQRLRSGKVDFGYESFSK